MSIFKQYIVYAIPVVILGLLLIVLHIASPLGVGPAGILLVFILIYALVVSTLYCALHGILQISARFFKKPIDMTRRKLLYYLASTIGLGPVFLLALNSIGQLEIKDFVLVVLLVVVACFYIIRRYK